MSTRRVFTRVQVPDIREQAWNFALDIMKLTMDHGKMYLNSQIYQRMRLNKISANNRVSGSKLINRPRL